MSSTTYHWDIHQWQLIMTTLTTAAHYDDSKYYRQINTLNKVCAQCQNQCSDNHTKDGKLISKQYTYRKDRNEGCVVTDLGGLGGYSSPPAISGHRMNVLLLNNNSCKLCNFCTFQCIQSKGLHPPHPLVLLWLAPSCNILKYSKSCIRCQLYFTKHNITQDT